MQLLNLLLLVASFTATLVESQHCFGCGFFFSCNPLDCPGRVISRRPTYYASTTGRIADYQTFAPLGQSRYVTVAARILSSAGGLWEVVVQTRDSVPSSVTAIEIKCRLENGRWIQRSFDPIVDPRVTLDIPAEEANRIIQQRGGDITREKFHVYCQYQLNGEL